MSSKLYGEHRIDGPQEQSYEAINKVRRDSLRGAYEQLLL
jgi:hypothetical protein